jgi:aspartate/methionine/tyrosine aminotransferase
LTALLDRVADVHGERHPELDDVRTTFHEMGTDHDRVGELLAELRALTSGHRVPADGCASYEALYRGLAELEADTHLHPTRRTTCCSPPSPRTRTRIWEDDVRGARSRQLPWFIPPFRTRSVGGWSVEFTRSGIAALLDFHPTHNLGESTGVDLTVADFLDEAAVDRLRQVRLGYGSSQGDVELRRLLAAMLGVGDDEVLVTSGGSASFAILALVQLEPGGHVVVTAPNFPPTLDILEALGTDRQVVELGFDDGYVVDADRVNASIRPTTRLVHLTTPANPSGTAIERATVAGIADHLASVAPSAVLVVDESYRQARHGDRPEEPSFAGFRSNIAVTGSLSKCHGAPGLRTGWIATPDEELMTRATTARLAVFISSSVVDEFLAIEILRRSAQLLAERAVILERGRQMVEAWVAENEHRVEWIEPAAGALCTIRVRPHIDLELFRERLLVNDAMVGDGDWFSSEPGVFRIGFGYLPIEQLPAALEAVGTSLDESGR